MEKMKIKVHYISLVKTFTKTSQDDFDLKEGTILADLLEKVAAKYGKPFTGKSTIPQRKK